MRRAWEKTVAAWEDTYNEEWIKYDYKAIAQRETKKLYAESGLAVPLKWFGEGDLLGLSPLGVQKSKVY